MAHEEHLELLRQGAAAWNAWRETHPDLEPYLIGAELGGANLLGANLRNVALCGADLKYANLYGANLEGANLADADLYEAQLHKANLRGAYLSKARLSDANLSEAILSGVDLSRQHSQAELGRRMNFTGAHLIGTKLWEAYLPAASFAGADLRGAYLGGADLRESNFRDANLRGAQLDKAHLEQADFRGAKLAGANLAGSYLKQADLRGADLTGSNFQGAQLIESNIDGAELSNSRVYGISVWDVRGTPKDQTGLIITPDSEASITVDDLEVAQFIHLLLEREKLRNVIDTITSKAVLILGRFTPERKVILDALAAELRKHNLLPIIFDFDRSTSRDVTETIKTLAGLSFFVIADITNPKSSPLELQATVPDYQIPFVPILEAGEAPFSMFRDLPNKYDWVLPVVQYSSLELLLQGFKAAVLDRAWAKRRELEKKKAEVLEVLPIEKFLENSL
jgi:uncharacterized protein YjbI with pentapeptide repeats